MKIRPFGVKQWMNEWETRCAFILAETCVESLTMQQMLDMTGKTAEVLDGMLKIKMTYGPIIGSERLRHLISVQYVSQTAKNLLITHGAMQPGLTGLTKLLFR